MKINFLLILLITVNGLAAQDNAINKYFKDFQEINYLDAMTITPKMFTVFLEGKQGKEREELAVILKKLTVLKVIGKENPGDGIKLYNTACSLMPVHYEMIMALKETDRCVKFFTAADKAGKITELVMVAFQWSRFFVVDITGDININDIIKLSHDPAFQNLKDLQKQKLFQH